VIHLAGTRDNWKKLELPGWLNLTTTKPRVATQIILCYVGSAIQALDIGQQEYEPRGPPSKLLRSFVVYPVGSGEPLHRDHRDRVYFHFAFALLVLGNLVFGGCRAPGYSF